MVRSPLQPLGLRTCCFCRLLDGLRVVPEQPSQDAWYKVLMLLMMLILLILLMLLILRILLILLMLLIPPMLLMLLMLLVLPVKNLYSS